MAYFNILEPGEITVSASVCLGISQDHVSFQAHI